MKIQTISSRVIFNIWIILLAGCSGIVTEPQEQGLTIATWKVRGYPETQASDRDWFHNQLLEINLNILCVKEIANRDRINTFLASENQFTTIAFIDSNDGQDNAIFTTAAIEMDDISDPAGFQHPARAAYVENKGFDAVIVIVHLSWTNVSLREKEKLLLKDIVNLMLEIVPDVIIAGDFNTQETKIQELTESIEMIVMLPQGQEGVGTTHAGNRYDHFLISPDLANEEALSCWIQTFTGNDLEIAQRVSDHLPVIAIFDTDLRYRDRK